METKDMILEVSLGQFAQAGYAAASVRDIAKRVGIKDSSLYFHFKSKQAILDALTERFINTSTQAVEFLRQGMCGLSSMDADTFMRVTEGYMESYLLEPFINKFIRVLMHEQSDNGQLRDIYRQWCIEKPVEFQTEFMKRMQEMRFLKQAEAQHMAEAYYAPIFLYFHRYLAYGEGFETQKDKFLECVRRHARLFLKEYGV